MTHAHLPGRHSDNLPPRPTSRTSVRPSPVTSPLLGFADHDAILKWRPRLRRRKSAPPPASNFKPLGKRRKLKSPVECWIYRESRPRYRLTSVPSLLDNGDETLAKVIERLEKEVDDHDDDLPSVVDEDSMDVDGILSEVEADTPLPMDRDLTPQLLRRENDEYLEFDQEEINLSHLDLHPPVFGPDLESVYDTVRSSSHQSVGSNASTVIPGPSNNTSDSSQYFEPTNTDPFSPLVRYVHPVDADQSGPVYSTVVDPMRPPPIPEHLRLPATAVSGVAQLPKCRPDRPKLPLPGEDPDLSPSNISLPNSVSLGSPPDPCDLPPPTSTAMEPGSSDLDPGAAGLAPAHLGGIQRLGPSLEVPLSATSTAPQLCSQNQVTLAPSGPTQSVFQFPTFGAPLNFGGAAASAFGAASLEAQALGLPGLHGLYQPAPTPGATVLATSGAQDPAVAAAFHRSVLEGAAPSTDSAGQQLLVNQQQSSLAEITRRRLNRSNAFRFNSGGTSGPLPWPVPGMSAAYSQQQHHSQLPPQPVVPQPSGIHWSTPGLLAASSQQLSQPQPPPQPVVLQPPRQPVVPQPMGSAASVSSQERPSSGNPMSQVNSFSQRQSDFLDTCHLVAQFASMRAARSAASSSEPVNLNIESAFNNGSSFDGNPVSVPPSVSHVQYRERVNLNPVFSFGSLMQSLPQTNHDNYVYPSESYGNANYASNNVPYANLNSSPLAVSSHLGAQVHAQQHPATVHHLQQPPPISVTQPPVHQQQYPTPCTSDTVTSISAHAVIKSLKSVVLIYTDNFSEASTSCLSSDTLKVMAQQATDLRHTVQTAFLDLEDFPTGTISHDLLVAAAAAKRGITQFILQAEQTLRQRECIQPQPAPDRHFSNLSKRDRVAASKDELLNELIALELQIDEALLITPETEKEFRTIIDLHQSISRNVKSVKFNASRLADLAGDCGLINVSKAIEEKSQTIQRKERKLDLDLQPYRNLYGTQQGAGSKTYEIKAPIFSGDPSKDKVDFYEFSKRWNDFFTARCLTPGDCLRTLKLSCLQGPAKDLCEDTTDVEEIFRRLKESYGDPMVLLHSKLDDIRRAGRCEGTTVKKRDWLVSVKAKLTAVQTLAISHGLSNTLYHSAIAKEVISKLPPRSIENLKDAIAESTTEPDNEDYELFELVISALDEAVKDATLTMRLDGPSKPPLDRPKKPDPPKTNSTPFKKSFSNIPDGSLLEKPACPPKPALKKKKSKLAASTKVLAVFVKPATVSCPLCNKSHTHLFYCETFLNFTVEDRPKESAVVKSCYRCLRMDARLNSANKKEWKKEHLVNCVTKFACEVDLCKSRSPSNQWHILMCRAHITQNKALEKKFIADCDKSQYTPALKFFFSYPVNFSKPPDHPHTARVYDGFEVKKDVPYNAIFMLQQTLINGKSLLTFYDSGCATCCLSEYAAGVTSSVVVRKGPTLMQVAGGDSIPLDHGDEQFVVTLVERNTKAYMTGLRMPKITTKFPAWPLHHAWEQIQSEYIKALPDGPELPPHPDVIGGDEVHLMIGIRYNAYYPTLLTMLPSGLGIYKSKIAAPKGQILILGGPHPIWDNAASASHMMSPVAYLTAEARAWYFHTSTLRNPMQIQHMEPGLDPEMPELLFEDYDDDDEDNPSNPNSDLPVDLPQPNPDPLVDLLQPKSDLPVDLPQPNPNPEPDLYLDPNSHPHPNPATKPGLPDHDVQDLLQVDTGQGATCSLVHCLKHDDDHDWFVPPEWDISSSVYSIRDGISKYLEAELSGAEVTYRCIRCRNCNDCRKGEYVESISLKEEREQHQIEESVTHDPIRNKLTAKLPFTLPPEGNLSPNRFIAEKVLQSQLRMVAKNENTREEVVMAHEKLASKGYVVPLESLPIDIQAQVTTPPNPHYYIPWRTVAKPGSISTPHRIVFDASATTPGGESLNSILAKGANRLLNIQHILTRFRAGKAAVTSDIRMAYNQLELDPSCYRYQLYLWKPNLNPDAPTITMVVVTCIYGVKPSGNQLQAGLGLLGDFCIEQFPQYKEGALAVVNNTYVDDNLSPADGPSEARELAKGIDFTLALGGLSVKAYTFSGEQPSPEVSADGKSVGLVGLLWEPEQDTIKLDIKDLFLGKIKRGKIPELITGNVSEALRPKFTRRIIMGKVAGIFDPLGLLTPITCKFKLDLHSICELKADWDDILPEEYLLEWVQNLDTMQRLKHIKFRRAVIPPDAANTDIELIVSSDASQFLALACVHARVKLISGDYSAQLLTARSKLVKMKTIPKAELRAATMAAGLGHMAKVNMGHKYSSSIFVSDSTVALFWIGSDSRPLKTMVRNSVIEIRRFSDPDDWFHIESALNPADLGTRPATLDQVDFTSEWQTGMSWMKANYEDMPLKTTSEITLTSENNRLAHVQIRNPSPRGIVLPALMNKVADRYDFSAYIIDPNVFAWPKTVRALAYVLKYLRIIFPTWRPALAPPPPPPSSEESTSSTWDDLTNIAQHYFYRKATLELYHFSNPKDYKEHSVEKHGVLHYAGRILEGSPLETPVDSFLDVQHLHFVKPILDRFSPVAYSVMLNCHDNVTHHRSPTTTLRESRSEAYILKGRDLANEISEHCRPCKRYRARLVEVEMGNLHESRLTIAPPFYFTQIDLFGPFEMVCEHQHRSTLRGYGVVFKDPGSGCVAANALQSYSTESFLQAFTRFASRYGVPDNVLIDQGSQLVSAFENMDLCLRSVEDNLSSKYNVSISYSTAPVGGHNFNGSAERSIKEIKNLLKKTFGGHRLDLLTLETALAWICSELNSFPICLGSKTQNLGNLDLLTPSRLLLGRNNRRSLGGYVKLDKPSRMMEQLDQVYKTWWEIWKSEKLCDFIPQPNNWNKSNYDLAVGDIVAFPRQTSDQVFGDTVFRLGRVTTLEYSADGKARIVHIEYRNAEESVFRTTKRAVRTVAKVHREHELDIVQGLNQAVKAANVSYFIRSSQMQPDISP